MSEQKSAILEPKTYISRWVFGSDLHSEIRKYKTS